MIERRGFTLIEVTTAIVITGVVSLLAYGSVQAGLDTADRVERHRSGIESAALMRSLVSDALRHPASSPDQALPSFSITQSEAQGVNAARLQFVSRGVSPPHGAGALWNVVLELTPNGLRLRADPMETTPELALESTLPGIRGVSVRSKSSRAERAWNTGWESRRTAPYAVEITFFDAANREVGAPMVVVTAMEIGDEAR